MSALNDATKCFTGACSTGDNVYRFKRIHDHRRWMQSQILLQCNNFLRRFLAIDFFGQFVDDDLKRWL